MPGPYPREFREDVVAVARRRGLMNEQVTSNLACPTGSAPDVRDVERARGETDEPLDIVRAGPDSGYIGSQVTTTGLWWSPGSSLTGGVLSASGAAVVVCAGGVGASGTGGAAQCGDEGAEQ